MLRAVRSPWGATPEQGNDAFDSEKPAHAVTLNSYYIGKTEVTQALWEAVMGNNPSDFNPSLSQLSYFPFCITQLAILICVTVYYKVVFF